MPQLSLYLDDAAMESLRCDAGRSGTSLSRYARELIQNRSESAWPVGFWSTYGALDDSTFSEPAELDANLDGVVAFD